MEITDMSIEGKQSAKKYDFSAKVCMPTDIVGALVSGNIPEDIRHYSTLTRQVYVYIFEKSRT